MWLFLAIAGATETPSWPAEQGRISGKVRDELGAGISAVTVVLTPHGHSSFLGRSTTDSDGSYSFAFLPSGRYTLTAEHPRFRRGIREVVRLSAGQIVEVNFTLVPASGAGLEAKASSTTSEKSLESIGFADTQDLRASEVTGSIDPGGYSAPAQAERTARLLEGVVSLKSDSHAPLADRQKETGVLANTEQALKKSLEAGGENFDAYYALGDFYVRVNRWKDAIPFLEHACRLNPSHFESAEKLVWAYMGMGDYLAAKERIFALSQKEDRAEWHSLMAAVEEKLGNRFAAARQYEIAAQMDPTDDRIFDWGANLLLHRALEPATNVFQRGVDRHPRSVKLWIGLAVTFHSAGRSEDAVRALVQATDLDPADPRPYLFLGKLYNIATAEGSLRRERLRRFAELHPDNPQANYYYAMSLWKGSTREHEQEDFGRIESLLKRAAELPPGFPDAHLQLGNLYADQGKTAEAIQEYQRAINRQPDLPDAHYRLAQVLSRTGQKERAQRELAVYEALRKQQAAGTERQNAEIQEFISTIREKSER